MKTIFLMASEWIDSRFPAPGVPAIRSIRAWLIDVGCPFPWRADVGYAPGRSLRRDDFMTSDIKARYGLDRRANLRLTQARESLLPRVLYSRRYEQVGSQSFGITVRFEDRKRCSPLVPTRI